MESYQITTKAKKMKTKINKIELTQNANKHFPAMWVANVTGVAV